MVLASPLWAAAFGSVWVGLSLFGRDIGAVPRLPCCQRGGGPLAGNVGVASRQRGGHRHLMRQLHGLSLAGNDLQRSACWLAGAVGRRLPGSAAGLSLRPA